MDMATGKNRKISHHSVLPQLRTLPWLSSSPPQKKQRWASSPLSLFASKKAPALEMGRCRAASAKREEGLKKKAWELATLCGVDVCLVGVAPDGRFFCWPDDISEVGRIARRYLEAVGESSNDREAPVHRGAKRKRAAAGETASSRCVVPRTKRAKGSQRDGAAATHEEQERAEGEGSDSAGVRAAGSPDLHFDFAPAAALPPEITGSGAADVGWLTVPPLAPSPSSAILSHPAAVELGYGGDPGEPLRYLMDSWYQESPCGQDPLQGAADMRWDPLPLAVPQPPAAAAMSCSLLAESVLDCGSHIREFLLQRPSSPSQEVSYNLGLLSAVDCSSTMGIPTEAFFHSGAAVDTSDVARTRAAAWTHMAPPETAVGVGYYPAALFGVSACPPSAVFGLSGGLGLLSAVDRCSTMGIPTEAFFHSGAAVDTSEVARTRAAAWTHVAPPATAVGVGYYPAALCGVSACGLGLLSAVDRCSTMGIPAEAFFHSGAAVNTSDVARTRAPAWTHVAPPETAVGVGYYLAALSGVSACPPSAAFGLSGGSDGGTVDPLGMAAAALGLYHKEVETISHPSWASSHIIMF